MKRLFDIVIATMGLLALLPVLAVCAIAVRLSSSGPIFFTQPRVGLYGTSFKIFKFRTMRISNSNDESKITIGRDPRITRIGGFLRKWKLDELPQLWNVMVGDMSFVGPRPEVTKYVETYPAAVRDLILSVRPGITDPCSIYLRNESDILAQAEDPERFYVETLLPKKLYISGEYVKHRTFFSDIGVILRTISSLVRRVDATP
jgi:lipopolysaccharide/colanic/teichoic acid biosynthesis glycosyltransferase